MQSKPSAPRPGTGGLNPNELETKARQILDLDGDEPTPQAQLDPQAMALIAELDPEDQAMAMAVIGCAQQIKEQVAAAAKVVAARMAVSTEQIRNNSLGQKLILNRAIRGTLSEADVERARGILTSDGQGAAIDPVQSGIFDLLGKNRKMLALMGELGVQLKQSAGQAAGPVLQAINLEANGLGREADALAGEWAKSPQAALGEVVAGFEQAQDVRYRPQAGGVAGNVASA